MKVIGITGGIGAGKSTVSGYLASLGYPVFDADEVSRGLTAAGSPVVDELAETFGEEILVRKGVLSREKLAEIVFSDPDKNRKLMQIVTMKVREAGQKWISDYRKKEKAVLSDHYFDSVPDFHDHCQLSGLCLFEQ